jgi:UDP-3-O-[3-hydroxymyristoyl] glucosamine N-acyltransferase
LCFSAALRLCVKWNYHLTMRVRELAEFLAATYEGDGEHELCGAAALESAGPGDVAFVASRKAAGAAESSPAGCLLAPLDWPSPSYRTVIRVKEPRTAFARALSVFYPTVEIKPGVHATAVIGHDVELGAMVTVGPHAVIGDQSRIGVASKIGAGCVVGKRVALGEGCMLHPNVTIYDNVEIGRGTILHSGVVIGADGFGYVIDHGRWHKFPQVGRVEIGDFVEIGANSCVDRAALGVTSIGEGTKLDNMVHVGHNCRIGRHVVVAAQTGFSGGVVVEDYAVIGGQVGIGDKARIESRATLGSGCGVLTSKIVRSGETVWGTPARPLRKHLEQLANLARLPDMRRELAEMKRRLAELEGRD